jgi:hypothetical protein
MLTVLALASCGASAARSEMPLASPPATGTTTPPYAGTPYTDAKLGFRLLVPAGWTVVPQPGAHGPADTASVMLLSGQNATIQVGVIRGTRMPAAFAARGTPTGKIGAYPAFSADTTIHQGKVPCLVRIFLAGQDYVLATWCAMDAASHAAQLDALLATYGPAPAGFQLSAGAVTIPPPQSCAAAQRAHGYDPSALAWGRTLATPGSASAPYALDAYICSNTSSPDQYLFECTELVNRVIREQWGLPHIPGSAARYLDYYQDGVPHPGAIRDFSAGTYQISDDATQGTSAFAPRPGDLLVFQDVLDPAQGWQSGLAASPGHVALITGVDATHVYVAQENYSDSQYFLALPLAQTAQGWAIRDLSGIPDRLVRGWIHFTADWA